MVTFVSTIGVEHNKVEIAGTGEQLSSAVSVVPIPKGTLIGNGPWKTRLDIFTEVRQEGTTFSAICYDTDEYGIGKTQAEALADLLTSLVDYRSWLEKRENRLGEKERNELARLRELLER